MPILEVNRLTKLFGGLAAVNDVNFAVKEKEVLGLIGPNGAGKSTVFNLITGFIKPTKGKVTFKGHDITALSPNRIALKGIARTFQLATFFGEMTVLENVLVALHVKATKLLPLTRQVIRSRKAVKVDKEILAGGMNLLDVVGLTALQNDLAMNLPHGLQRRLSVAIALAVEPELLLLDEIVSGMNAEEIKEVLGILYEIHKRGTTIILIEHNMRVAMEFCERFVVLNYGRKIAEGTPEAIANNEHVIEAYLGSKRDNFTY